MDTEILSADKWAAVNRIVAAIYQSFPQPKLVEVIGQLKSIIDFSHSLACLISTQDDLVETFEYISEDIPAEHLERYKRKYIHFDFMLWYCVEPRALVFRESDVINAKIASEATFMREWMEPIGAYWGAGTNIAADGVAYGNIVLYRSREEGDFSDEDIAVLKIVNDHLCTCFRNSFPKGLRRATYNRRSEMLRYTYHLTSREIEVVEQVKQGCRRNQLAASLFLAESTIKKHLNSIYRKTGLDGFDSLIRFAAQDYRPLP